MRPHIVHDKQCMLFNKGRSSYLEPSQDYSYLLYWPHTWASLLCESMAQPHLQVDMGALPLHRFLSRRFPRQLYPRLFQYLNSRGLLDDPTSSIQNAGMFEPRMGCVPKSSCKLCNAVAKPDSLKVYFLLLARKQTACQHVNPSVLGLALERGNKRIIKMLLDAGATYDKEGHGGRTSLLQ